MLNIPYFAESMVLVISLTLDVFAASLSYGAGRIRIPLPALTVISLVCTSLLAVALCFGSILHTIIPPTITQWGCFLILLTMGFTRLCDSAIKSFIRRNNLLKMQFSLFHFNVLLTVYADVERADWDGSKSLSPKEACFLACALSLDGLAVGLGSGLTGSSVFLPIVLSLILTAVAVSAGSALGRRIVGRIPFDLSYLSAILLLLLAFIRYPLAT